MPLFESGLRTIQTHALAERRFCAFLNSASMFRDRLALRLSGMPAGVSLRQFISFVYDSSYEYRLCYNLRNRAQHHESPFHIIPLRGKGVEGVLSYEMELELSRDRLMRPSRMQSKVRDEIKSGPERIDLLQLCTAYKTAMAKILAFFFYLNRDRFATALFYEQAVRQAHPTMPKEATPLLFHDKPKGAQGEEMTCKVTSFSFDELDLIKSFLFDAQAGPELAAAFAANDVEQCPT